MILSLIEIVKKQSNKKMYHGLFYLSTVE